MTDTIAVISYCYWHYRLNAMYNLPNCRRFLYFSEIMFSLGFTTVAPFFSPFLRPFPSSFGGSSLTTFYRLAFLLPAVNSTVYSSSLPFSSSSLFSSSSGANSSMILANPKSQILTTNPWPFIRTLAGFRSLCTMFAEWRYFILSFETGTHITFGRGWNGHHRSRRRCCRF